MRMAHLFAVLPASHRLFRVEGNTACAQNALNYTSRSIDTCADT